MMKFISWIFIILTIFAAMGYAQNDSIFVTVSEDSVIIWNTHLLENCASRFKFSVVMNDSNAIIFTQTDTIGPIANCICSYDLSATLTGLGIGHYTIDVYRQYLLKYYYEKDTTVYIGSTTFDITYMPSVSYSEQFYQSECGEFTGVSEEGEMPNNYSLEVNYPNPFNPSTQITFSIQKATNVTLKVFDVLGQQIALLVNERKQAGEYRVTWNAEGVPSGVYFYRIVAGDFRQTKKMILVR